MKKTRKRSRASMALKSDVRSTNEGMRKLPKPLNSQLNNPPSNNNTQAQVEQTNVWLNLSCITVDELDLATKGPQRGGMEAGSIWI